MHACIFWGFLSCSPRSSRRSVRPSTPDFALPWVGHAGWLGLAAGRVRRTGARGDRDRPLDPPGAAAGTVHRLPPSGRVPDPRPDHVDHPDALPAPRSAHRARGQRLPDGVDPGVDGRLASVHVDERRLAVVLRVVLPLGAPAAGPGVPRLPAVLEAPAHHHERDQRLVLEHPPARRVRAAAHRHGEARVRRAIARSRDAHRSDAQGVARPLRMHGVRPLPERLPRMEYRQAAFAEAPHHGPARSPARGGPRPAADARGRRDARTGRAGARRGRRRRRVVVHDVRRVRAGVPRGHRAHRHDRRSPPGAGDGRVAVPGRSRRDAAQPGEPVQPVGRRAIATGRLGRRAGRAGRERRRPRVPLLGGLRGLVRRTGPRHLSMRSPNCCSGRGCRSRSSGRESSARAIPPAGWATSSCSRPSPSRTSRR